MTVDAGCQWMLAVSIRQYYRKIKLVKGRLVLLMCAENFHNR